MLMTMFYKNVNGFSIWCEIIPRIYGNIYNCTFSCKCITRTIKYVPILPKNRLAKSRNNHFCLPTPLNPFLNSNDLALQLVNKSTNIAFPMKLPFYLKILGLQQDVAWCVNALRAYIIPKRCVVRFHMNSPLGLTRFDYFVCCVDLGVKH